MSNANQEVALDEVSKKFEAHLNVKDNFRIIFSGKYGTGKSFFLNKYFNDRKDKYNKFLISPVNYVVSSNDDIFELIKVDIIKQLFFDGHVQKIEQKEKSELVKFGQFLHEKSTIPIKHIVSLFSKVNPYLTITDSVIKGIEKLSEEYKKYEQELKSRPTLNSEFLEKFVDDFTEKPGNIFEEDFITQTINSELENIRKKGKKANKQNVLIIDDLDRIDPEHIFRILNILSAHNNHWDKGNKFQFDKIIIVCDIDNIHRTYCHRYGKDVDFSGYIDKFYSTDVFFFSNRDAIIAYVNNYLAHFLSVKGRAFLCFILIEFFNRDKLTLRKILKSNIEFENLSKEVHRIVRSSEQGFPSYIDDPNLIKLDYKNIEMLKVLKVISVIWGGIENFLADIKDAKESGFSVRYNEYQNVLSFNALTYFIVSNFTKDDLFFTRIQTGINRGVRKYAYTPPQINTMSINFEILYKWNSESRYNSECCYLEGMDILPISCGATNLQNSSSKMIANISISSVQFFTILQESIKLIRDNRMLSNYGI